ncbi:hypothetical protein PG988_007949 [Apiospora saccharicola]
MVDFRPTKKRTDGGLACIHAGENRLGKNTIGIAYRPVVPRTHLYSSLLGVSHESRSEALRTYRVRLPCLVWTSWETAKEAVLYFSPERDFLHLHNTGRGPVRDTLVDLFCDLKTYDPKGVGLLNLAIDYRTLDAWDRFLRPQEIDPPSARAAYLETLSQLQKVLCFEIRSFRSFMALEELGTGAQYWHGRRGLFDEDKRKALRTAIRSHRIQFGAQWSQVLVKAGVAPSREQQQLVARHEPLVELWAVREWHAWGDGGDNSSISTISYESEEWQGELEWVFSSHPKPELTRSLAKVEAAFGFWLFSADADLPELGLLTF